MTVLFVEYPKCSTCKKAKAWLDEHGVEYVDRDIVTDNPCLLYTSPSPRDPLLSRMPSSA